MTRVIGLVLIAIGIGLGLFVLYQNSKYSQIQQTFAPYSILKSSWEKYKSKFINPDGRVIDYTEGDITTSEGQSYALLRAVWVDDKDTFDQVWTWTHQTLKRPNDNLLGWRWGKNSDGKYGFIDNGGDNSASDADTDIALALIFASKRWHDPKYLDQGKVLLSDIWDKEVDSVNGKNYLVAGNWSKGTDKLIINPSYFSPYAYRIFAKVDTKHPWNSLIDPGYELLSKSSEQPLDKVKSSGLPPNWVAIDRKTGQVEPTHQDTLKSDYSYDAIRVPFRIALDYQWFKEARAEKYLKQSMVLLTESYRKDQKIPSVFSHDGKVISSGENPSVYGAALAYFKLFYPDLAKSIYQNKIIKLYALDKDTFNENLPYYDQNWLWFGTAFYNNFLINLAN